jgi:hypothetical protein
MLLMMDMLSQNEELYDILRLLTDLYDEITEILEELDGAGALDEINALMAAAIADFGDVLNGGGGSIGAVFMQLADDISLILDGVTIDTTGLLASAVALYDGIAQLDQAELDGVMTTLEAAYMFTLYVNDTSNPPGFDLFYSDDGVTWEPYTVKGFGDANNYGGRVIIPSDYGLLILTANPFTGCQVWNLNDVPAPLAYLTESGPVKMDVGGSTTFYVRSVGLDPSDIAVAVSNNTAVNVKVELVGYDPTYYISKVEKVFSPTTYGSYQWAEEGGYGHVYRVTLTGLSGYSGTLDVTILAGTHSLVYSMSMDIAEKDDGTDNSRIILMAALVILGIVAAGGVAIFFLRR